MILYHLTLKDRVNSILKCGLCINTGISGMSDLERYQKYWGMQPIFLSRTIDYVLNNFIDIEKQDKYTILIVNASGLSLEDERQAYATNFIIRPVYAGEIPTFVCRTNIEPSRIELFRI